MCASPQFVAGATKLHLGAWYDITSDPVILQMVSGIKWEFVDAPTQLEVPREYMVNADMDLVIAREIAGMLQKGVIYEVWDVTRSFVSNIFTRPKPDGKVRVIIDLSELNKFISTNHFKMDHLETATQMLFRGAWLASIDLSDAYYTLPIHPDFQRYICFQWAGRFFHYTCLPFGISCAPWIFTKTLKPIFAEFHKEGHHGFGYIDDSFIIAETRVECLRAVNELKASFERLGFRINEKKSVLQPTHVLKFLGYLLNSSTMTVSPTQDKIEKVVGSVQELLNCRRIKIRRVASVLGLLNDVCKATEYGSAHTKNLEVQKIEALRRAGSKQFEGTMYLDTESVMDLRWWGERFPTATKTMRETSPVLTLMVDASQLGWGACLGSERAQGRWSIHEGTCHINVLEVRAVLLGLRSLCADKHGTGIGVLTDSTTALAYVSHMGGTRSRECNRAALELWHWCKQRAIWLVVNHIPGVENVVADYESRNFTENTEWKLNPQLFAQICKLWNTPNIDLFA